MSDAEQELRALLAEYLGTRKGAHDITDVIVALVDEAVEARCGGTGDGTPTR